MRRSSSGLARMPRSLWRIMALRSKTSRETPRRASPQPAAVSSGMGSAVPARQAEKAPMGAVCRRVSRRMVSSPKRLAQSIRPDMAAPSQGV